MTSPYPRCRCCGASILPFLRSAKPEQGLCDTCSRNDCDTCTTNPPGAQRV